MEPIMKVDIDPSTRFPYLLPAMAHGLATLIIWTVCSPASTLVW
jgi:hypothetical protein